MGLFTSWRRKDDSGDEAAPPAVIEAIEDVLSSVPTPHVRAVADAAAVADGLARDAARRAAVLSGSLALPPGPLGVVTVLPDLYLIWKVQRQMVADIFAAHGHSAALTSNHMLYCLFRHLASHVLRDAAVRTGERVAVRALAHAGAHAGAGALGKHVTRRVAGSLVGRWIPLAGAAAVGAYAYWDTMQVARAARRLLAELGPVQEHAAAADAGSLRLH
jgi:hypothetical protein